MTGIASNPIPLKYAYAKIGFDIGKPRLPLIPADPDMAAQVDKLLENYATDLPL